MTITPMYPCYRQGLAFGEVGMGELSPQHPLLTGLPRKGPGNPEGLRKVGRLEGLPKSMWLSKAHPTQPSQSGLHRGLFQVFSGPYPDTGSGLTPHTGPWP